MSFFGFTRIIINKLDVQKVLHLLPENSDIDIYIYIPESLHENNLQYINQPEFIKYIKDIFNLSNIKNINIEFFKYDPTIFIIKSKKLNLPFKTDNNMISYRIISQIHSITKLSNYIRKKSAEFNIHYDCYILTRFDVFNTIESFGNCIINTNEHNIHIWRTIPYYNINHAEDRIIITSKLGIDILSNYYYNLNKLDFSEIGHEVIFAKYLNMTQNNNLEKCSQDGIIISLPPFINLKYDPVFIDNCYQIWQIITKPLLKNIYITGDSHAMYNFSRLDIPHMNSFKISTTMYRVSRDKLNYLNYKSFGFQENDMVVYQYGEIDCRCHIGKQLILGRELDEIIESLTTNYIDSILENIKEYVNINIVVCCVPPPIDQSYYEENNGKLPDDFPVPFVGTNEERVLYTKKTNSALKQKCQEYDFYFLDYYDFYSNDQGLLKPELSDGKVHIKNNDKILEMFKEIIHTNFEWL